MAFSAELQNAYDKLNPEQRLAVDTIDGPVLVVAGPGTGKTQLLSLRVANILDKRDVQPSAILCLTFTEAGAEAMQRRLTGFIGRDAYSVQISTFHSFATQIRSNYPEYFEYSAFATAITNLQSKKLIESFLQNLDYQDPIYQKPFEGNYGNVGPVAKLIGNFKKAGLTASQLRAIIEQNSAFFEYAASQTELLQKINSEMPRAAQQKQDFLDGLQNYLSQLSVTAPNQLSQSVVDTPGIYTPYINYICEQFKNTELYELKANGCAGKTTGYQELRKTFFSKDQNNNFVFKDLSGSQKLLSVVSVYEQYQQSFKQQALYDFDDMILDAIQAISSNPQLQAQLQDQYKYLLVDEFQDTNGSQMQLLDLLCAGRENPNILAVGDDDQAIMRFQGASVEYLNQFEQHYQSVQRIVLKTNYRSTPLLVGLGQEVAKQVENRSTASATEKQLQANRAASTNIAVTASRYFSQEVQYYEVAKAIRSRIDAGFVQAAENPTEAIAIIAPKHASLKVMIPYLRAFDIAYSYRVTTQITKIQSLQTLFALMHFVVAYSEQKLQTAEAYLPQILAAPEFGFAAADYFDFAIKAKQDRAGWLAAMLSSPDYRKHDLAVWLVDIAKDALGNSATAVISELAKPLSRYYKNRDTPDPISTIEFNYGLKELLDFAAAEYQAGTALGTIQKPMLLKDIEMLLKDVNRFGEEVSISVPVERPDAINLTSAHSSKGLEFDLVYLIDADKRTWSGSRSDSLQLNQNMLFGTSKDADDTRRLLFVALTRPRFELEVTLGRSEIVPELVDELQVNEVAASENDIVRQSEIGWESNYYPSNPQLLDILRPSLAARKMSASLLNRFLTYDTQDPSQSSFVLQSLVSLPSAPSVALEFGSKLHSFFEEYLNKSVLSNQSDLASIVESCKQQISNLDFEKEELEPLLQRFDLVVEHFLPILRTMFASQDHVYQSERHIASVLDDVPLTGYCDLLELDNQAKTIKVLDYKTGKANAGKPDRDYLRQLQFYKLLIESSPEYQDWTVVGGADIFVEPERPDWTLAQPQFISVSEPELEHLRKLIKAVWQRIQTANFDVSDFENSEQLRTLRATSQTKDGKPKPPSKDAVQEAFEDWLIAEHFGNLMDIAVS